MATKGQLATLETFNKRARNANRKEKLYLDEDELEYIEYNPFFSKTKRIAAIQELMATVHDATENKDPYFANEYIIKEYLQFLMIKHFSTIKDMLEGQDFEVHKEVCKGFVDTEFMDLMINEIFDFEEISKVWNEYNIAMERLGKYIQELNRETKQQQNIEKQRISNQKFKEIATKAVK